MFSLELSDRMLTPGERSLFAGYLHENGVDESIWDVYACFMRVRTRSTQAKVVRVYRHKALAGAAFVARCKAYGRSLFNVSLLHAPIDIAGLPSFIWIRVGFGAEVLANPGFVAEGFERDSVIRAMIDYLCRNSYGVMITDAAANRDLHGNAHEFRYVSDGIVDVRGMRSAQDYVARHRNIKRKIKEFTNKGGVIEVQTGQLSDDTIDTVARCIQTTVSKSVIHSPFQDGFPQAVCETCRCPSASLVHFVARMNGGVLGYHSFIRTGRGLRMLHGAFDRNRRTTYHCYENIIIETVRYAIDEELDAVHFGPILNETKRRMMNIAEPSKLFFYSSNAIMRVVIPLVFPYTKMQDERLLTFAD